MRMPWIPRHLSYEKLSAGKWIRLPTDKTGPDGWTTYEGAVDYSANGITTRSENEACATYALPVRDMVIRAKVKRLAAGHACVTLRRSRSGSGYSFILFNWNYFWMAIKSDGKLGIPQQTPANEALGDECTLVFAAIGDRLTAYCNGKRIFDVRDSSCKAGTPAVSTSGGQTTFRDIEVRMLDTPTEDNKLSENNPQPCRALPRHPLSLRSTRRRPKNTKRPGPSISACRCK